MARFVGFGEVMLRLSPPGILQLRVADSFEAVYGGAEANVLAALAAWGMETELITRLPANPLGEAARASLRRQGVGTRFTTLEGERLGIYFLEKGVSVRGARVVYDRKDSAFSKTQPDMIDWMMALKGAQWLHLTGITPALNQDLAQLTLQACEAAREMGVQVSCDLNYRPALWEPDQAGMTMERILPYVSLLLANREHLELLFGIRSDEPEDWIDDIARQVNIKFGKKSVAVTCRAGQSASETDWWAMLFCEKAYKSRVYHLQVAEPIGAGDAFAAGLLYGLSRNDNMQETLDFAAAACALKQTIYGDALQIGTDEIYALMAGAAGRTRR